MGQQAYGDEAWSGPYTEYVGRHGGDSRTDFEPVLEALPYGAFVIDVLGRVLCVNRRYASLSGIVRGMTLEEVIVVADIRDLAGNPMTEQDLPEAQVASVMGVAVGTASATLATARRALASALDDDLSEVIE